MRRIPRKGELKAKHMANKKKVRKVATAVALPQPKPPLPMPALLLRIGLILAAAAGVQHFLPHP